MRQPYPRNTAVLDGRRTEWMERFAAYRDPPTEGRVERWLGQFGGPDRDTARRVLDCVEVISTPKVADAFRNVLQLLPGWSINENERDGRWYFVGFSSSPGESGDAMAHVFRQTNGLGGRKFNSLFKYISELPGLGLGSGDNVVFIDDFAGTGDQACDSWQNFLQELFNDGPKLYLLLVCATVKALARISNETELSTVAEINLDDPDDFFSVRCSAFNAGEKEAILRYGRRANQNIPKGYGDSALLIVFAHRCPNNTLPILHANNHRWKPLFPRHF